MFIERPPFALKWDANQPAGAGNDLAAPVSDLSYATLRPAEVRSRAVRMVLVDEGEHPSRWAAISSIAAKANEILRKASAYFAQAGLDHRFKP